MNQPNAKQIFLTLCTILDTHPGEMSCKSRVHELVQKRQIISYVMFFYCQTSQTDIGKMVNRHPSSINHSIQTLGNDIEHDPILWHRLSETKYRLRKIVDILPGGKEDSFFEPGKAVI